MTYQEAQAIKNQKAFEIIQLILQGMKEDSVSSKEELDQLRDLVNNHLMNYPK